MSDHETDWLVPMPAGIKYGSLAPARIGDDYFLRLTATKAELLTLAANLLDAAEQQS